MNTRDRDAEVARKALDKLCHAYWTPVYAFVRRTGLDADQARDCTQTFFAALLEKHYLAVVERSKGNFRSFLMVAIKHFLSNHFDAEKALKRGGSHTILSLDYVDADGHRPVEPDHSETPDAIFDYHWAASLLERTLSRLRQSYPAAAFDVMKPFLVGDAARGESAASAAQLGMTDGAFKVAIHRMRKRYREALWAEIAETVADRSEVEGEIRYLMAVLARGEKGL